ncbi:MAG: hypothetical protein LC804_07985 [Acidobacteria bacterium]|nr:hypothetical protein [Acidobacteriota bacterium]
MLRRPRAIAILLSIALGACDVDFLIVGPGPIAVGGTALHLRPIAPFPQSIPVPTCPAVQPFVARFEVTIGGGRIEHNLDRIDVWFSDGRGNAGPTITFGSADIARQFGSTTVAAGRSRVLVMTHAFGCGTLASGTVIVFVRLRDANGAMHSMQEGLSTEGS